jgi:hypothetical protein
MQISPTSLLRSAAILLKGNSCPLPKPVTEARLVVLVQLLLKHFRIFRTGHW